MNVARWIRKLEMLGKRDPTATFSRPASAPRLCYDITTAALNGISYTSTVKDLEIFGPASEAYPLGVKDFMMVQYDASGLLITLDAEGVVSFELSFSSSERLPLGAAPPCRSLTVETSGSVDVIDSRTSPEWLDAFLGPAYDRFDLSSGDLCSQYSLFESHFVACHSRNGRDLLRLEMSESASTSG